MTHGFQRLPTVLGVNFSGADPNAALVAEGTIIAAVEEERFLREKHAHNRFPSRSVQHCLDQASRRGLTVDFVAFGWSCDLYSNGQMARFYEENVNKRYPVDDATRDWQRRMLATFHFDNVSRQVNDALIAGGIDPAALPPIRCFGHHRTHAAGAYLLSPFERAAVVTMDGSGDDICSALWAGQTEGLERTASHPIPHSLGWYYAALTEYLGFQAYDGEYKVMGLAPYGRPDSQIRERLRTVLAETQDGYALDPRFIHYGPHTYSGRFTDNFAELLGSPPRMRETDPSSFHKAVAYEGQALFEDAALRLVERAVELAGTRILCLSGGCSLNCKMSQRVLESGLVDDIFVLPNGGDGGQALSAALLLSYELTGVQPDPLRTMAFGPAYGDAEIKSVLNECLLDATYVADLPDAVASDLAAGKVVGWFQGRMEFGPRSLGQRSILADPRRLDSRDKVNRVVKYREYWRPFCPSLLAEKASRYFATTCDAPFMAITLPVIPARHPEIPAVVHVDGTARPQFVDRQTLPLFHEVIRRFGERTGTPVVLNTSFNVKGEPIVCTPRDAVRNFYSCGMDALYIGNFRLEKKP